MWQKELSFQVPETFIRKLKFQCVPWLFPMQPEFKADYANQANGVVGLRLLQGGRGFSYTYSLMFYMLISQISEITELHFNHTT